MKNNLKTSRFLILPFFIALVIFSACKDDDETIFLTAETDKIAFEEEGGEKNLCFDCNSSWMLSCDASWLSFAAKEGVGKGIVPMTCKKNDETTSRSAVIKIYSGKDVFSVTVTQGQLAPYFNIEKDELPVPANGGVVDLSVSGNVFFSMLSEISWIKQVISADVPANVFRFQVEPNYQLENRNITLVVGEKDGACRDSVKITQSFVTDSRTTDSIALVALYRSTGGETWVRQWDLNKSMNLWDGITLSAPGSEGRVTELLLWDNNMNGPFPTEIKYLSQLTLLHVGGNHLSGSVPAELAELKKLELLAFPGNNLEGTIPAGIGALPMLANLYIDNNKLEGEIPADILNNSHWSDWKNSNFCRQQSGYGFTNCEEVKDVEALEREILLALYQSTNGSSWLRPWDLNGPVTEWSGVVTEVVDGKIRVKELNLWDNNLTGTFPGEIGGLEECVQIHIGGNAVGGSVPAELGNLSKLTLLGLQGNRFTGTLPAALGNLVNLPSFYIDGNQLSGAIPAEILNNPNWSNWRGSGFCNQQGSGFTNCQ